MFKKPIRTVTRTFLHCSASDATGPAYEGLGLVRTITAWHLARKFATIGYHFVIDKQGVVSAGRNIESTPAAQEGNNTGTIAICLHGLKKEKFTPAQFASLKSLVSEINKAYNGKMTFHGHCEVSAKSCPVFDYKMVLGLDKKGYSKLGVI